MTLTREFTVSTMTPVRATSATVLAVVLLLAVSTATVAEPGKEPGPTIDTLAAAFAAQEWDELIEAATLYLKQEPGSADAYAYRGQALYALSARTDAVADLTKAIELAPGRSTFWVLRGTVRGDEQDLDGAISDYGKAIELSYEGPEARYLRGRALLNARRYSEAIEDMSVALESAAGNLKRDALYYCGLARNCLSPPDYDGAVRDFTDAIKLSPDYANAYRERHVAHRGLRDYASASADCARAIELSPSNPQLYQDRAQCQEDLGNHEAAIEDYTSALTLVAGQTDATVTVRVRRARAYAATKHWAEAVADYDAAIALNPRFSDRVWVHRGECLSQMGEKYYGEEVRNYDEAIKLDPEHTASYLRERARTHARAGKPELAVADYDKLLATTPDNVDALSARAEAHRALEQFALARDDYDAIIKLQSTNPGAHLLRAYMYMELRDFKSAARDFATAQQVDPSGPSGESAASELKLLRPKMKTALAAGEHGARDVILVDLLGWDERRTMAPDPGDDFCPSFSANTGRVAFASNRGGNYQIYVVALDGSGATQLTDGDTANLHPAFSPQGDRIAFVSLRDGNPEIYTMNADGTDQARATTSPEAETYPCWAYNGTRIAFTRDVSGHSHLFLLDPESGMVNQLTSGQSDNIMPSWSPDERFLAFASNRGGKGFDLYRLTIAGESSEVQCIASSPSTDWLPQCLDLGGEILFMSDRAGTMLPYIVSKTSDAPAPLAPVGQAAPSATE